MFGIGPTELLVIMVIALLVLGPKRLPDLARSLGRAMAEFRRATSDITTELDNARIMLEEETRAASREGEKRGRGYDTADRVAAAPATGLAGGVGDAAASPTETTRATPGQSDAAADAPDAPAVPPPGGTTKPA